MKKKHGGRLLSLFDIIVNAYGQDVRINIATESEFLPEIKTKTAGCS